MSEDLLKIAFSSNVRAIVSAEKDKILSLASLDKLSQFLPSVDAKNVDLLPISFNACVVNRFNKNSHGIDTKAAINSYNSFIYKPLNVEHERNKLCGVIITAGFSAFGSDKPLTLDEVKDITDPFNIVLGGVVWRNFNAELADYIEDSSDPSSPNYQEVSASWEIGFKQYDFYISKNGSRNLSDCVQITDKETIAALSKKLKDSEKLTVDDQPVYTLIKDSPLALACALTESPAADVKGICTAKTIESNASNNPVSIPVIINTPDDKVVADIIDKHQKEVVGEVMAKISVTSDNGTNISNTQENTVKSTEENISNMKKLKDIVDINELTDEILKSSASADVRDFISSRIKDASEAWTKEQEQKKTALDEAKASADKLRNDYAALKTHSEEVEKQLNELKDRVIAAETQQKFDVRMDSIDSKYALTDAQRKVIASKVKTISDDKDFTSYLEELASFLTEKTVESKASTTPPVEPETPETVVGKTIDKGSKTQGLPNTTENKTQSLKDRMKDSFSLKTGFTVNHRK